MAYGIPVLDISLTAADDYSANQYHFVIVNGNGEAEIAGAGAGAIGVLQNKPGEVTGEAGEVASVRVLGISKVVCGATIAAGTEVTPDADGKAVAGGPGDRVCGVALMDGDEDEVISILVYQGPVLS